MTDNLVNAEKLSREQLRSIFDAAFMEYSLDSDGDIIVREGCSIFVLPDKERRRIRLLAQYGFKPTATLAQKLEAVNKMNAEYIIVRACAHENSLRFDYDVLLEVPISPKALILAIKRFAKIPNAALNDHALDIVA